MLNSKIKYKGFTVFLSLILSISISSSMLVSNEDKIDFGYISPGETTYNLEIYADSRLPYYEHNHQFNSSETIYEFGDFKSNYKTKDGSILEDKYSIFWNEFFIQYMDTLGAFRIANDITLENDIYYTLENETNQVKLIENDIKINFSISDSLSFFDVTIGGKKRGELTSISYSDLLSYNKDSPYNLEIKIDYTYNNELQNLPLIIGQINFTVYKDEDKYVIRIPYRARLISHFELIYGEPKKYENGNFFWRGSKGYFCPKTVSVEDDLQFKLDLIKSDLDKSYEEKEILKESIDSVYIYYDWDKALNISDAPVDTSEAEGRLNTDIVKLKYSFYGWSMNFTLDPGGPVDDNRLYFVPLVFINDQRPSDDILYTLNRSIRVINDSKYVVGNLSISEPQYLDFNPDNIADNLILYNYSLNFTCAWELNAGGTGDWIKKWAQNTDDLYDGGTTRNPIFYGNFYDGVDVNLVEWNYNGTHAGFTLNVKNLHKEYGTKKLYLNITYNNISSNQIDINFISIYPDEDSFNLSKDIIVSDDISSLNIYINNSTSYNYLLEENINRIFLKLYKEGIIDLNETHSNNFNIYRHGHEVLLDYNLHFSGISSDVVDLSSKQTKLSSDSSLIFWVNLNFSGDPKEYIHGIFSNESTGRNENYISIYNAGDGEHQIHCKGSEGIWVNSSNISLSLNKWHQIAIILDDDILNFYYDGQSFGSYSFPDKIDLDYLGVGYLDSYLNGSIDEVIFYDRKLSSDAIWDLYSSSEFYIPKILLDNFSEFNGIDDQIDLSSENLGLDKDTSLIVWIRPKNLEDGKSQGIFSSRGIGSLDNYITLAKTDSGKAHIYYEDKDGNARNSSEFSLSLDKWHQIAIVMNEGGIPNFYYDGEFLGSDIASGKIDLNYLGLGHYYFDNRSHFNGSIGEVTFYDKALSSNAILALNNSISFSESKIELYNYTEISIPTLNYYNIPKSDFIDKASTGESFSLYYVPIFEWNLSDGNLVNLTNYNYDSFSKFYKITIVDDDSQKPNLELFSPEYISSESEISSDQSLNIVVNASDAQSNLEYVNITYQYFNETTNITNYFTKQMQKSGNSYNYTLNFDEAYENCFIQFYIIAYNDDLDHIYDQEFNSLGPYSYRILDDDNTSPRVSDLEANIFGSEVVISADIVDSGGIYNATLFYRNLETSWKFIDMFYENGVYNVTLEGNNATYVEYYVVAFDNDSISDSDKQMSLTEIYSVYSDDTKPPEIFEIIYPIDVDYGESSAICSFVDDYASGVNYVNLVWSYADENTESEYSEYITTQMKKIGGTNMYVTNLISFYPYIRFYVTSEDNAGNLNTSDEYTAKFVPKANQNRGNSLFLDFSFDNMNISNLTTAKNYNPTLLGLGNIQKVSIGVFGDEFSTIINLEKSENNLWKNQWYTPYAMPKGDYNITISYTDSNGKSYTLDGSKIFTVKKSDVDAQILISIFNFEKLDENKYKIYISVNYSQDISFDAEYDFGSVYVKIRGIIYPAFYNNTSGNWYCIYETDEEYFLIRAFAYDSDGRTATTTYLVEAPKSFDYTNYIVGVVVTFLGISGGVALQKRQKSKKKEILETLKRVQKERDDEEITKTFHDELFD